MMEAIDTIKSKQMKQSAVLKFVHGDQMSRLQQKYQLDIELLDDLRLFGRQRSVIEKVYAQSLIKLVQQLLVKRAYQTQPANEKQGEEELLTSTSTNKRLLDVWRTVLTDTELIAKQRLIAADVYQQQLSEACKRIRTDCVTAAKTAFDQLSESQKDVISSVQEVGRSQKIYRDEEQITYEAKVKADGAENKVKNKSVGRFTSMAKLQQQSAKLSAVLEACQVKSTAACNEYLLNLAAANSHLSHYYKTDLPELTRTLDGNLYTRYSKLLTLLSETELSCSRVTTQCFTAALENSAKISREYDHQMFLRDNPVFSDVLQIPSFIPRIDVDNKSTEHVSPDHEGYVELKKQARMWAIRLTKETKAMKLNSKKLSEIEAKSNATSLSGSAEVVTVQTKKKKVPTATLR